METELGARLGPSEQAFPSVNAHRTPDGCVAQPWRSLLSRTVPCTGGSTRPRSQPSDVSNASPLLCDRETPPHFQSTPRRMHVSQGQALGSLVLSQKGLGILRPGKSSLLREDFTATGTSAQPLPAQTPAPGREQSSLTGVQSWKDLEGGKQYL